MSKSQTQPEVSAAAAKNRRLFAEPTHVYVHLFPILIPNHKLELPMRFWWNATPLLGENQEGIEKDFENISTMIHNRNPIIMKLRNDSEKYFHSND